MFVREVRLETFLFSYLLPKNIFSFDGSITKVCVITNYSFYRIGDSRTKKWFFFFVPVAAFMEQHCRENNAHAIITRNGNVVCSCDPGKYTARDTPWTFCSGQTAPHHYFVCVPPCTCSYNLSAIRLPRRTRLRQWDSLPHSIADSI